MVADAEQDRACARARRFPARGSALATLFSAHFCLPPFQKLYLTASLATAVMCMDISDFNQGDNATIWTWPCGSGSNTNEVWTVNANSIVSGQASAKCLRAGYTSESGVAGKGSVVTTATCDGSPAQGFVYSAATGIITHTASGLCVDADTKVEWCANSARSNWTICDSSADINARAADIVARLSLADKIQALGTGAPALPSVGLPAYKCVAALGREGLRRFRAALSLSQQEMAGGDCFAVRHPFARSPPRRPPPPRAQLVERSDSRNFACVLFVQAACGIEHGAADHDELLLQQDALDQDGQPDRA
jgi:hypothetical protein